MSQEINQKQLSIILITYNCVVNLKKCLLSVQAIADEIVVVDAQSTDGTADLARSFGAHVIDQEWLGYAAQKNVALEHASGSWILWMDSDECLSELCAKAIQVAMNKGGPFQGYRLRRRTSFAGRWMDHCLARDQVLRLFKNTPEHRFVEVPIHEKMILLGLEGPCLEGYLAHYPYKSMDAYLQKFESYARLYVKKNEELPVPSFVSLCCVAPLRFLKLYILKKGFLDGTPGLILCVLSSFHDFYKYAKCWESQRGVSS